MAKLGVRINLLSEGMSQVQGWAFNSVTQLGEFLLAAGDSGIKTLGGNTDGGVDIDAEFETPFHDLTIQHPKRIRKLYATYSAEDALTIKSTTDENTTGFTSTLPATISETDTRKSLSGHRNVRGVEWKFKINNTNGADFAIDSINALFVPLTRSRSLR